MSTTVGCKPAPAGVMTETAIEREAHRLHSRLKVVGWSMAECELIAPLTGEINALKQSLNAVVLAHSYQTPDIIYGIADHVGDSLALSQEAAHTSRGRDRLLRRALHGRDGEDPLAGRSACCCPRWTPAARWRTRITAADVRALKAQHPGVPVVCYVNTSAEVKAECDACCTSANTLAVVDAMPGDKVIFVPDKLMAANLRPLTNKEIIAWDGTCIVHENFGMAEVEAFRNQYQDAALLAHTECLPEVVSIADMAGSTSGMERYIAQHDEIKRFMLITECGMTDKLKVQFPDRDFVGACVLCPYMKKTELRNVLQAMTDAQGRSR